MAEKEELISRNLIFRTLVGTILALSIKDFLESLANDFLKPIFLDLIFKSLDNDFTVDVGGVKINYGDLIGHIITLTLIILTIYAVVFIVDILKIV